MQKLFPSAPATGTPMAATNASAEARSFLALRRSSSKRLLAEPGPDQNQISQLLYVAARVSDHRRLSPWRFEVFQGAAREHFNLAAQEILKAEKPDASAQELSDAAGLFNRAPTIVIVISSPDTTHKTPVWEQELSAGAVCHNLLLSANAAGWAGCWLTEWVSYSAGISAWLGLSESERVAGMIYLGTASSPPQERMRPDVKAITTFR